MPLPWPGERWGRLEGEAGCRAGRCRQLNALLLLPSCSLFCLTREFTDCVVLKTVVLSSGWEMLPEGSCAQGSLAGRARRGSGGSRARPLRQEPVASPCQF